MGVSDLRKLIKDFPGATKVDGEYPYTNVIIDCSNLITTFIMRHLSSLEYTSQITFRNYVVKMDRAELIMLSIDDQIELIIRKVIADTIDLISKCKLWFPFVENIILVSDPVGEYNYKYTFNKRIKMTNIDNMMFYHWLKLRKMEKSKIYDIRFNSKEEEKKIRIKSQASQRLNPITVFQNNKVVEVFNEYEFPEVEDMELNRIHHILRHCSYFIKRGNAMKLIPMIQQQLIETFKDDSKVKYFCSATEADVFIKAYYMNYLEDEYTLVISNDTDYSILFGEIETVDVVTLTPFQRFEIRNPYSYWSSLFDCEGENLRLILARLSALLGNDYTCHKRQLVCDPNTVEDWPMLFNAADRSIEEEVTYKRSTNIGKLLRLSQEYYDTDLLKQYEDDEKYVKAKMFKHVDAAVMENDEFFKSYYETLLIYMNIEYYYQYTEMESVDVQDVASTIDEYKIDFSNLDNDECLEHR